MFKIVFIFSYVFILFLITFLYKKIQPTNKEIIRKIIHIGIGPLIPIALYINVTQIAAQYLAGFISILVLLNYVYKIFPLIEDIDRRSFGTLFYCLSLFILISFLWDKDPKSLIIGSLIMSFGDGFAGLLGKNLRSKSWYIFNQKKSLIGTCTMFLVSLLVITGVGILNGYNFNIYFIAISLIATALEQISYLGLDNFTVPLISSITFNFLITKI